MGNIKTTDENGVTENESIDLGGLIGRIYCEGDGYYFINKCRVQTKINIKNFKNNNVGGILGSTFTYM